MKQKTDSSELPPTIVSRRAALRRVVATGLALGSLPALASASVTESAAAEPEFVPENDYPYFGYEPDSR